MSARCNSCGKDIPAQNITLHQLRCVGKPKEGDAIIRESRRDEIDLTNSSSAGWACAACTFVNVSSLSICSVCNVPRENVSSTESNRNVPRETVSSTWQCSYCTLLNGTNHEVCDACGQPNISNDNTTDYYSSSGNTNDNVRAADGVYRDQLIRDNTSEEYDDLDQMIAALRSNHSNDHISRGPSIENAVLGALGGALLAASYNSRSSTSSTTNQSSDVGNLGNVAFGAAVGALGVSLFDALSARQERGQRNFDRIGIEEFLRHLGNESAVDRGVDTRILEQLPIRKFNASECGANNRECSVCIESFKNGDDVMCLPCFHTYHKNCITPWLKTKNTCPVCKHQITNS